MSVGLSFRKSLKAGLLFVSPLHVIFLGKEHAIELVICENGIIGL